MPRYFIEVSYKGTCYSGFQVQQNAVTIQSEVESALSICFRRSFSLTGSSRTDAGVHALQNFFHFDTSEDLWSGANGSDLSTSIKRSLYSLNSILPNGIVVNRIIKVQNDCHSRFSATSREYKYQIYQKKNPFYENVALYYPYKINFEKLLQAADIILRTHDFASFSKRNTQVNNFNCSILKSNWCNEKDLIIYNIAGNRFLRGMVRGLVGTMLRVGSEKISIDQFKEIIESRDCSKADFSVPPQGLFLTGVTYPDKALCS